MATAAWAGASGVSDPAARSAATSAAWVCLMMFIRFSSLIGVWPADNEGPRPDVPPVQQFVCDSVAQFVCVRQRPQSELLAITKPIAPACQPRSRKLASYG